MPILSMGAQNTLSIQDTRGIPVLIAVTGEAEATRCHHNLQAMQSNMSSSSYSPLEKSRRWIKSPRQRASTTSSSSSSTATVRRTRKSFKIKRTAQSLLSRITCSPNNCYDDEAETTPIIYWADETCPSSKVVKKKGKVVDPFEQVEVKEHVNVEASSSVAFEIVGTIRFFRPTLDTIPEENQQQDRASIDPFETKTYEVMKEKGFEVSSSPTFVGSFDSSFSPEVAPMRLFPEDAFDTTLIDEESAFETFSFEGVNFEEEDDSVALSGTVADIADDESLEVWADSVGTMNGFSIAKDFQSHDWDGETDSV